MNSCTSPEQKPDWKAYALGELPAADRRQAESHAQTCPACREEMAMLRLTLDSLSTLREEEVPRRIAFVSDKVFEPKWWQRLFSPSFAAASVLAAAILVHAFVGGSRGVSEEEVQARIDAALRDVQANQADVLTALDQTSKIMTQVYYDNSGLERQ